MLVWSSCWATCDAGPTSYQQWISVSDRAIFAGWGGGVGDGIVGCLYAQNEWKLSLKTCQFYTSRLHQNAPLTCRPRAFFQNFPGNMHPDHLPPDGRSVTLLLSQSEHGPLMFTEYQQLFVSFYGNVGLNIPEFLSTLTYLKSLVIVNNPRFFWYLFTSLNTHKLIFNIDYHWGSVIFRSWVIY